MDKSSIECVKCGTPLLFHAQSAAGQMCDLREAARNLGRAILEEVKRLKARGIS